MTDLEENERLRVQLRTAEADADAIWAWIDGDSQQSRETLRRAHDAAVESRTYRSPSPCPGAYVTEDGVCSRCGEDEEAHAASR